MNYEQKYKESLKIAKYYHDRDNIQFLENIFPELRESEDERIRKGLIKGFQHYDKENKWGEFTTTEILSWLEKQGDYANFRDKAQIGDRITKNEDGVLVNLSQLKRVAKPSEKQGEQKSSWSEVDERMCQETIDWFEKKCFPYALENDNPARESIKWLKSLKDRVQPQPKQEWNVQDEAFLGDAIYAAKNTYSENCGQEELIDWLKSLKPNHWKPSEEEMEALLYALGKGGTYNKEALTRLYNDLKKL